MKAPTSRTRLAVLLGDPVEHSLSPAMQNAAFAAADIDAVFVALRVRPPDLPAAVAGLRACGALGASVTVPHKERVLELCDRVEEPAASIGAVNCLRIGNDGEVIGYNTDARGFVDGLAEELGLEATGMRVAVLGGGGAARAVAAGLQEGGAGEIAVVVRSPDKVRWTEAKPWTPEVLAKLAGSADLVVDCTPLGLSAEAEADAPAPFPVGALHEGAAVVSLVYHRRSDLITRAEERGLMVADGAGMLVHQGALAFRLWTGFDAPLAAMWDAVRAKKP